MTQNTQTTAERIAEMILRSIEQSIFDFDNAYDADPIAEKIAAEIDALTRERDEAQKGWEHYQARAEIAEGERDRYARDAALMCAVWNSYRDLLPGVRAELSKARAEVERLQTAAEAFWAYEVFTATYLREDRDKFAAAAARARAAKESQP